MLYAIPATAVKTDKSGTTSYQVPTFYLNGNVQGIVDVAHAERIAREVINPTNDPALKVNAYVVTVLG